MIATPYFVFLMALVGGFAGALLGEFYLQKRIIDAVNDWFGEDERAEPAKVVRLVKPKGRDDV